MNDQSAFFSLTVERLRCECSLQESHALAFVRCISEVQRQVRAQPSFFDSRLEQIRSIVDEWGMDLLEELGHGGFGKVYKCSLRLPAKAKYDDETQCAVKVVKCDKPARFIQEVKALSRLYVENIVRMFDVYPDFDVVGSSSTDVAVYSMQLLPSEDLRKLIEQPPNGPFVSQVAFLSIAEQLLDALKFIHSKGHFHGDIKPENILWKLRQGSGSVFLFENVHILLPDFGLVKTRDTQVLSGLSPSTLHRAEGSSPMCDQQPHRRREAFCSRAGHTRARCFTSPIEKSSSRDQLRLCENMSKTRPHQMPLHLKHPALRMTTHGTCKKSWTSSCALVTLPAQTTTGPQMPSHASCTPFTAAGGCH
jgi:serine/threonine protein kinase